ncbi:helix-turn-helix domain-containing protein [Bacterioplanoides sp.]|uniref:helix-turn-helix domain-containing protein n=1 Tax=Bacterioplanoides sp. TaxID=2066072 RepID=UPI003B5CEC81
METLNDSTDDKRLRNQAFGKRLKALRQASGFTQDQLAEQVGKSSETISKLERGLIYPGVDMLILLAEKLDSSLDELVGVTQSRGLSGKQVTLLSEAHIALKQMDEELLSVALKQLQALNSLSTR